MKKYIYSLFTVLFATAIMTSCAEDEGTNPGNDPNPAIRVYTYAASKPLNVDNDVMLRFAANNKTTEAYYLAEKTTDKNARIASIGEDAYTDYVISNGKKISDISGESNADLTLTDLYGEYTITAVAVGNGKKSASSAIFNGLDWADVAKGTYYFEAIKSRIKIDPTPTTLQVCTTDATLYRFKDLYGTGYSLKLNMIDFWGTDADGKYQFFRVAPTETPLTYGTYGNVSVRDIGYWQGNISFVTTGGYESGMYENHNCFIYLQWYCSGGSLGYNYDYFDVD